MGLVTSYVSCPSSFTGFKETQGERRPGSFRELQLDWGFHLPGLSVPPQGRAAEASSLLGTNHSRDRPRARQGLSMCGDRDSLARYCQSPANLSTCWTCKAGVRKHILHPEHSGIYSTTAHRVQDLAADNLIQAAQAHANAIKSIMQKLYLILKISLQRPHPPLTSVYQQQQRHLHEAGCCQTGRRRLTKVGRLHMERGRKESHAFSLPPDLAITLVSRAPLCYWSRVSTRPSAGSRYKAPGTG